MRSLVRLESSGEVLVTNYGKMILDRKHFSLLVQLMDGGHLNAAGSYAEGRVLESYDTSILTYHNQKNSNQEENCN